MSKRKKIFSRYSALVFAMLFIFSIILYRLVILQVVLGDSYAEQADRSSYAELQSYAPRGNIVDCNGQILATDNQSYMITYMETDDNKYDFIPIMNSVFKILDDNQDSVKDSFLIEVNPAFAFKFNNTDGTEELRFKKDRGLDKVIYDKIYKDVKNKPVFNNLSVEQQNKINAELMKITPEETFNYLVKLYDLTPEYDFMNLVGLYKKDAASAISKITERYKISSKDTLVKLLDDYKKAKKDSEKETAKNALIKTFGIDKLSYSVDTQRRLMLVKDALYMQRYASYKPVVVAENVKKNTTFIIDQKSYDLPGVNVENDPVRVYPNGDLASNVLGYISKISYDNKAKYEMKGYDTNYEYVGAAGIENAFEENLRGNTGSKIVKLNNQGKVQETLGEKQAYTGQTVQLTLDKNLQAVAEGVLNSKMTELQNNPTKTAADVVTTNATRGAVVVLNIKTGAVLALVSRPGFDPSIFSQAGGLTPDLVKQYINPDYKELGSNYIIQHGVANALGLSQQDALDKLFPKSDSNNKDENAQRNDQYDIFPKPLFNYATAPIPPGSTFKPVVALAGLESKVIEPSEQIDDEAYFVVADGPKGTKKFNDGANGWVNLLSAIAKSSNPYFMTIGKRLQLNTPAGKDSLAQYAWKLGLGVDPNSKAKGSTGIEIQESFGQVYNDTTTKGILYRSSLLGIVAALKSGKSAAWANVSFTPVDLSYETTDSDEVYSAKKAMKDYIKNGVETGNWVNAAFIKLLNKWLSIDPLYKDKKIPSKDIQAMAQEAYAFAVNDAYQQTIGIENICDASIGLGYDQFTPLQLASYISTLVNGGTRYKVHLLDKIKDGVDGSVISQTKPEVITKYDFNQDNIQQIMKGMEAVDSGDGGTAAITFSGFPLATGGKTGTATYRDDNINFQAKIGRTNYALYVGFAPANDPQIAVCAVIFDGGYGANSAPIARTVYEYYFKDEIQKLRPGYVTPSQYDYTKYLK